MKPTVISQQYLDLQTEISNKQDKWAEVIDKKDWEKQSLKQKDVPIITQTNVPVNMELYENWIVELADFLVEKDGNLAASVNKLKEIVTADLVQKWAKEVLAFNQVYFQTFAEKEELPEWLPYFIAEHSLRPFLRVTADVYKEELPNLKTKGACPCCGEPTRLAVLEGKGLKMIVCPRCEAKYNQKRLQCTFCGNEDHETISYYNIESDKTAKLEVCGKCNGYIKVIDTRKMFKKQTAFLLDVTTLHLDFVAQENEFGEKVEEGVKN